MARGERRKCLTVCAQPRALGKHRAVGAQTKAVQLPEDGRRGARLIAGGVEVLHAHEPSTAAAARLQVAGERRDQRAEM